MGQLDSSIREIRELENLARETSFVHRLDPRVKVIATFAFIAAVVSFDRYEIAALVPYLFFPIFVAGAGGLPLSAVVKRLLVLSPFVVLVGIFNPLYDRTVLLRIGGLAITGGWVSFAAILVRYVLTVSAALLLIASTGFYALCGGIERLGVPKVFVVQLLLLYRYIFVLTDEASRMARARAQRSFRRGPMEIGVFVPLAGALLLRTVERAQRIYQAMLARGFDGTMKAGVFGSVAARAGSSGDGAGDYGAARCNLPRSIRFSDALFLGVWVSLFALFRFVNLPAMLGDLLLRAAG